MEDKRLTDFNNSINILEGNIKLFHEGNTSVYTVIGSQLRLLLCDTHQGKDNSLLPRLFANIKLHPLKGFLTKEAKAELPFLHESGHLFQIPAEISFNGKGGSKIESLFDENQLLIPLQEWLDQGLFTNEITIRQLIRSIADKVGVHSDKDYDNTLKTTKSVKIIDEDLHIKTIIAIGEYLLKYLKKQDFKRTL